MKTAFPMLFTEAGIDMFVSFVQPWNAQLPIVVTVVGMAIETSFSQQSKAASPISVSFEVYARNSFAACECVAAYPCYGGGNGYRCKFGAKAECVIAYSGNGIRRAAVGNRFGYRQYAAYVAAFLVGRGRFRSGVAGVEIEIKRVYFHFFGVCANWARKQRCEYRGRRAGYATPQCPLNEVA